MVYKTAVCTLVERFGGGNDGHKGRQPKKMTSGRMRKDLRLIMAKFENQTNAGSTQPTTTKTTTTSAQKDVTSSQLDVNTTQTLTMTTMSIESSQQKVMTSKQEMQTSLNKVVTSVRGDSGYGGFSDTDRSEGETSRPSSGICESPSENLDIHFTSALTLNLNPNKSIRDNTPNLKSCDEDESEITNNDTPLTPEPNVTITPAEDTDTARNEDGHVFVNTTERSVAEERGKLDIAEGGVSKVPRTSIHDENGIIRIDETDYGDDGELSIEHKQVKLKKKKRVTTEFEMLEFLGRGKFGEVTKCLEKSTGKVFAAKCVYAPTEQMVKEVANEIDIMNSLHHARLLQLHDAFQHKDEINLVLECILGGELFDRVLRDDFILTERACMLFMRQICEGVEYMHSQDILHLDMKPENILCLTWTGTNIKIIDFGLARRKKPDEDMRVMFGTPEFMAPEVANYDLIGTETDMWSVGVVCYVLLTGLSPFMGPTDAETLGNVTKAEYDFNYKEFETISDTAKDFIKKLLIPDRTKRMSARECLEHEWLQRQPCKIKPKQLSKKKLRGFVCRRKWQKAVNAILALKRMGVQLQ
ncbi:unnamed protein product [Owenia fusiformis]|uniref:Uncharacterized protein n=1 Tax=Owenia fusiformis TaxID=6347 RepID=A0A8J1U055_OWEFU|nr:unnamed protein product [Owenia fusiformis]